MKIKLTAMIVLLVLPLLVCPVSAFAAEYEVQWILEPSLPSYLYVFGFEDGLAGLSNNNTQQELVYNPAGQQIVCSDPSIWMKALVYNERVCVKNQETQKYGFCDIDGNLVIPAIYDNVNSEGFMYGSAVVEKDGWLNVINQAGYELLPKKLYTKTGYQISYPSKDFIFIKDSKEKTLVYAISSNSSTLIGTYAGASVAGEGLACVLKTPSGNWGGINKQGNQIVPFVSRNSFKFSEGLAEIWENDRQYYIDRTGKIVISGDWGSTGSFSDGYAIVYNKDFSKVGTIDKNGKQTVTMSYSAYNLESCKDGMIVVYDYATNKRGFINAATGKIVVPLKYDIVEDFSEGIGVVKLRTEQKISDSVFSDYIYKCGLVDKNGDIIIPADGKYTDIGLCNEGMICAGQINSRYGYLDRKGNIVYAPVFLSKRDFSHGATLQYQNGSWGIIKNPLPESERQYKSNSDITLENITVTAKPTSSKVLVNEADKLFDAYMINGNNYFKLRDLASAVSGTEKQFEVTWDNDKKAINLVSDKAYTAVGGEMSVSGSEVANATINTSKVYKNGTEIKLIAYTINGNNYFKLRDIAKEFNIGVNWDATTNTIGIDTSISYTD